MSRRSKPSRLQFAQPIRGVPDGIHDFGNGPLTLHLRLDQSELRLKVCHHLVEPLINRPQEHCFTLLPDRLRRLYSLYSHIVQEALYSLPVGIKDLQAVTGSVNQAKSDSDPAQWLPPLTSAHCTYATTWVAIEWRWGLTIDPAERDGLGQLLSGTCGARQVQVSRA